MLGIGAGDYPEEAEGLGLPFPASTRERFEVLEDTIGACLAMWKGEHGNDGPFVGQHARLDRTLNLPQCLSRPHPPIMIAGSGEKRTLSLVAAHADACNLSPTPELPHKLGLLRRLCDERGRDYDTIEKTVPFRFDVGTAGERAGEVVEQLRWLAGLGVETVIGWVVGVDRMTPLDVMSREVIPAAGDLVPAR